ncbi:MAG: hypothetical protein JO292_02150 [Betaproteobacteria bacterium]|nr:hypothetical protein [Betaproteobacteria bacterium]
MSEEVEKLRVTKAFSLAFWGFAGALALATLLALKGGFESKDITAIVGIFTTLLGSLVGTLIGIHAGSQGKEQAEKRADEAKKTADRLQGQMTALTASTSDDVVKAAIAEFPQFFS